MNSKMILSYLLRQVTRKVFDNNEGKAYIYWSRARGEAQGNADRDILVITKEAADSQENYDKYVFPFAKVGWMIEEEG